MVSTPLGKSLVTRLVAATVAVSLSAVALATYTAYRSARAELQRGVFARLRAVAVLKEAELDRWVEEKERDVRFLAGVASFAEAAGELCQAPVSAGRPEAAYRHVADLFGKLVSANPDFREIALLSRRGGRVVASSDLTREGDYRVNDTYFVRGVDGVFTQQVYPSPVTMRPTITVASPLRGPGGETFGVLVAHLNLGRLDQAIRERTGLGETGEVYMVDAVNTPVSAVQFGLQEYPRGLHSEGVDRAARGEEGEGLFHNYAGVPVVGVYRWVEGLGIALLVETSQREAFAAAGRLATRLSLTGVVLALALGLLIRRIAGGVANPVLAIGAAAEQLAGGNLQVQAPVLSDDEVGRLAATFNRTVDDLRELYGRVQESEARYRLFADNVTDVLWTIGPDLRPTFFSPSIKRQRGWTPEEALQLELGQLFPPESLRQIRETFASQDGGAEGQPLVLEMYRRDGSTFWGEITFTALHDSDGVATGAVGITRDVTDLRQAGRALRESETRYRTLFESSFDAILIMDGDRFVDCNPRAMELFRCSREDLVGRTPQEFSPPTQQGGISSAVMAGEKFAAALAGRPQVFEWLHRLPDGHEFQASVTLNRLELGDRTVAIAEVRDITEQVRMEIQLAQAQKMEAIGTLAGGIAHDFNNILSAVMGYAELAQLDLADPERASGDLDQVLKASNRARDLVGQILAFSRRGRPEVRPVQVRRIADEALKLLRASLPTTIEIDVRLESDALTCMDPTQVHQILMNLCTNAGHAMREAGGTLRVTLGEVDLGPGAVADHPGAVAGRHLQLCVADTGLGMPPEIRDRVFEPFFTTKERGEGTGMGLSVVHGIVQDCGGFVEVASTPGEGTEFRVYFPVVDTPAEARSVERSAESELVGQERVLFVDDEVSQCDLARAGLGRYGYRVTALTSSREALARFEADPQAFDVVISDVTMPEITGDVLAKRLLLLRPDLPILLCTGFSERIDEATATAMGIRGFAFKPVVFRDLAAKIREFCNG